MWTLGTGEIGSRYRRRWTQEVFENPLAIRGDAGARALQAEGTAWAEAERLASPDHTNNSVHTADDMTPSNPDLGGSKE